MHRLLRRTLSSRVGARDVPALVHFARIAKQDARRLQRAARRVREFDSGGRDAATPPTWAPFLSLDDRDGLSDELLDQIDELSAEFDEDVDRLLADYQQAIYDVANDELE